MEVVGRKIFITSNMIISHIFILLFLNSNIVWEINIQVVTL